MPWMCSHLHNFVLKAAAQRHGFTAVASSEFMLEERRTSRWRANNFQVKAEAAEPETDDVDDVSRLTSRCKWCLGGFGRSNCRPNLLSDNARRL